MNHNFRELSIWNRSMDLVLEIYQLTRKLPEVERFSVTSQSNCCAVSIPSNILEGTSRNTNKDISRFMDIALGSSYELETQIILVGRLYEDFAGNTVKLVKEINEIQKMIGGFKRSIMRSES